MSARRGSLQGRFLGAFAIAMVPFVALAWFFQNSILEDRAMARQFEAVNPVWTSSQLLREKLSGAALLAEVLEGAAEDPMPCEELLDTVRGTRVNLTSAGIYATDGSTICADAPADPVLMSKSWDNTVELHEGGLLMIRPVGADRIVVLDVPLPAIELPELSDGLALLLADGRQIPLSGREITITELPQNLIGDGLDVQIYPVADHSAIQMRVSDTDMRMIATLNDNYAATSRWLLALRAAVSPLSFLVISLGIAAVLIQRFALRDIAALRREMAAFRAYRTLPNVPDPGVTTHETLAMREDFSALAAQLLSEERAAQERLHNAEVLQREVFHRVSNNFQVIQSIIRLIGRETGKSPHLDLVSERVQLLSAAHHAVHKTADASLQPVGGALQSLVDELKAAGWLKGIAVQIKADERVLPVYQTYALVHLATEALRRLERSGSEAITIALSNGKMTISGADTPLGQSDAISRRLKEAFTRELHGQSSWEGSTFVVTFPMDDPRPAPDAGPGPNG